MSQAQIASGLGSALNESSGFLAVGEVNPYELRGDDAGIPLITAPQDFTASWVDLGIEFSIFGYNYVQLWLALDINDSLDLRFRLLEKHESGGVEEYVPAIETYGTSDVKFEPGYHELNVDADVLIPLVFKLSGLAPYGQVQIQAGTVGATAGQVDLSHITRGTIGG
jgi:hypothetical protein